MPDEARDGRNVAFELSSDLLVCSIVQRNHSTNNAHVKEYIVPGRMTGYVHACTLSGSTFYWQIKTKFVQSAEVSMH